MFQIPVVMTPVEMATSVKPNEENIASSFRWPRRRLPGPHWRSQWRSPAGPDLARIEPRHRCLVGPDAGDSGLTTAAEAIASPGRKAGHIGPGVGVARGPWISPTKIKTKRARLAPPPRRLRLLRTLLPCARSFVILVPILAGTKWLCHLVARWADRDDGEAFLWSARAIESEPLSPSGPRLVVSTRVAGTGCRGG